MSINENTRNALREMGLNAYEIEAYMALLEVGQMTAMEISQEAKVPYSKMYEVLNSLKEKGWIKAVKPDPLSITRCRRSKRQGSRNCGLKTSIRVGKTLLLKLFSPSTKNVNSSSELTC